MLRTYPAYSHDDLLLLLLLLQLQLPAPMLLHPPAIHTPQPSLMVLFTPPQKKKPVSFLDASSFEE
jgi:hypothetical protein